MNIEEKHVITKAPRAVIEALQRDIGAGTWKPGDSLGSECQLAARYEVSRTTIRVVLNLLKKENILQVVPRRGIFLNAHAAKSADHQKRDTEFIFIRYCDDSLTHDIATGMSDYFREKSKDFTVIDVNLNPDIYAEVIRNLPEHTRAAALIPIETSAVRAAIVHAISKGVRIVQMDRYLDGINTVSIVFDNFGGAFSATKHLLERHNHPVWFFGNNSPVSAQKRYCGWRDAMIDYGYLNYKEYEIPGIDEGQQGELHPQESFIHKYMHIKKILESRGKTITVIFAFNDYLARLVYLAAAELQLTMGRDVFVAGFDNLEMCTKLEPQLTSVRVPRREMGYEAARLMASGSTVDGSCKVIPVDLRIRESSNPAIAKT